MATVVAPARPDRAFERLYRRHVADVYRYVLAVLQNEADAEDATQSAFLCAYRAYERGERPERPLNWLIAIAHNVCRERWRESARRPRVVALEDEVPARTHEEESPKAGEIRRALGFLAFNQRAALVMRELQGRSYDEIAEMLGISTSAVETLLFRARRALREQLEGGLSCGEAELALSKRADRQLGIVERGRLRAHLRECAECSALERRQRFRRAALRSIGTVPLPSSLGSFFGGSVAGTSAGVGAKAAAVVVAGVLGSGVGGGALSDRGGAVADQGQAGAVEASTATTAARPPTAASVLDGRLAPNAVAGAKRLRVTSARRRAAPQAEDAAPLPATAPSVAADAPPAPADPATSPEVSDAPGPSDAPAAADAPTTPNAPAADAPVTADAPAVRPPTRPVTTPDPPERPRPAVPETTPVTTTVVESVTSTAPSPTTTAPADELTSERRRPKPTISDLPQVPDVTEQLPATAAELLEKARTELEKGRAKLEKRGQVTVAPETEQP